MLQILRMKLIKSELSNTWGWGFAVQRYLGPLDKALKPTLEMIEQDGGYTCLFTSDDFFKFSLNSCNCYV